MTTSQVILGLALISLIVLTAGYVHHFDHGGLLGAVGFVAASCLVGRLLVAETAELQRASVANVT